MLEFIIMTLSFTVAILLAGALSLFIMLSKPVIKWYMKKVYKFVMTDLEELAEEMFDEEEKSEDL